MKNKLIESFEDKVNKIKLSFDKGPYFDFLTRLIDFYAHARSSVKEEIINDWNFSAAITDKNGNPQIIVFSYKKSSLYIPDLYIEHFNLYTIHQNHDIDKIRASLFKGKWQAASLVMKGDIDGLLTTAKSLTLAN